MSEKLHQTHEKGPEAVDASQEAKHNLERLEKAAEAVDGAEKQTKAEQARHKASKEAVSGKDISVENKTESSGSGSFGIERNLKAKAYQKSLSRIRDHLSPVQRTFSKFTHQPAVDKTSAIVGQTVARPTGILGGAICAFLGSAAVLVASRYYGFSYNYLLLVILFIGGYLIGSLIELALWLLLGNRKRRLS